MRTQTIIDYPFLRGPIALMDEEGPYVVEAWRPGTIIPPRGQFPVLEYPEYADCFRWCHGVGKCVLTEIETVRLPKPYKPRVFYLRTWIDPDGKAFGKRTLRVTTQAKFQSMCQGYFYVYEVIAYVQADRPVEVGNIP